MTDHPSQTEIELYVDSELPQQEAAALAQHLTVCHACSTRALEAVRTKAAIRQAGTLRYKASPALQRHLVQRARAGRGLSLWGPWVTSAVAACLIAVAITAGWQRTHRQDDLSVELLDQHIALLADGAPPQVISSDKHTVRPWYQGKIPFTFNLPDTLPPDTTLQGANLTYIHGEATAVLLYRIRKHPVSVYVMLRHAGGLAPLPEASHSGFEFRTEQTSVLRFSAVSDATAEDLQKLMASIVGVQSR